MKDKISIAFDINGVLTKPLFQQLFHVLVMLTARGVNLEEVMEELEKRKR